MLHTPIYTMAGAVFNGLLWAARSFYSRVRDIVSECVSRAIACSNSLVGGRLSGAIARSESLVGDCFARINSPKIYSSFVSITSDIITANLFNIAGFLLLHSLVYNACRCLFYAGLVHNLMSRAPHVVCVDLDVFLCIHNGAAFVSSLASTVWAELAMS